MKKSLLALAVLGAFAGVASAQSSVTLYGTIDLNAKYVKNDGSAKRLSLSQDGINSSQLGFRGIEDLGGGLKAGFVLLAGVNADQCVMTTLEDASFLGYDVLMLRDCVATTSPDYCMQATEYNVKLLFGFMTTSQALIAGLSA